MRCWGWLPLVILLSAADAPPAPVRVAASVRAGVEVFAAATPWCAERPVFTVVAERIEAYAEPAFADAMQRFGGTLVASDCPAARGMVLSGTVRGGSESVWRGSADAAGSWVVRTDAPPPVVSATPDPAVLVPAAARVVVLDAAGQAKAMASLGSRLGAYNAARRCIPARLQEEGWSTVACLRVVRATRVETAGTVRVYVQLAGRGATDCHACSGMIAFAALDASGPAWTVLAVSKPLRSGSNGEPTAAKDIRLQRLGAHRWGWIETTFYVGCGEAVSSNVVFLSRGSAIVEAGQLPGDQSNAGNCVDGMVNGGPCLDTSVTLSVDQSDASADAYPIVLRAVIKTGQHTARQEIVVSFDPAQQKWVAPEGWPNPPP